MMSYLRPRINDNDYDLLLEYYVESHVGAIQRTDLEETQDAIRVDERHFLDLYGQLTDAQQNKLLKIMLQNIEDNKNKMAQNAGLEPENTK